MMDQAITNPPSMSARSRVPCGHPSMRASAAPYWQVAPAVTSAVLLAGLLAWPAISIAQQDRGQPGTQADELALGQAVTNIAGLPAGPIVSGAELDRRTNSLSSRVRCPVCQGHAVVDSPSESARAMKRQVRAMIAAGYNDEQILRYFEASYGEFIRLMPRATGFNLLVWVVPLLGMLVGLAVMIVAIRRRRPARAVATPETGADDDHSSTAASPVAVQPRTDDPSDESSEQDGDLEPWLAKVREEMARDDG